MTSPVAKVEKEVQMGILGLIVVIVLVILLLRLLA